MTKDSAQEQYFDSFIQCSVKFGLACVFFSFPGTYSVGVSIYVSGMGDYAKMVSLYRKV